MERAWNPALLSTKYFPEEMSKMTSSLNLQNIYDIITIDPLGVSLYMITNIMKCLMHLQKPKVKVKLYNTRRYLVYRKHGRPVCVTNPHHLTCGVGYPSTVQKSLIALFSYNVWDLSLTINLGPLIMDSSRMYFSGIFFST